MASGGGEPAGAAADLQVCVESPGDEEHPHLCHQKTLNKIEEFELRVVVTEKGRLKMVHRDTERDQKWQNRNAPDKGEKATECKLQVVENKEKTFSLNVDGPRCFELKDNSLEVASLHDGFDYKCPLRLGDVVVGVNNERIDTREQFDKIVGKDSVMHSRIMFKAVPTRNEEMTSTDSQVALQKRTTSIEFDVTEVCCVEDQGKVEVPLRRVGEMNSRVTWPWRAWCECVPPHLWAQMTHGGDVVFEPGQDMARIVLDIPNDSRWNAESLYCVKLVNEDDMLTRHSRTQDEVNVRLAANKVVKVFSLNTESFPANVYGRSSLRPPPPPEKDENGKEIPQEQEKLKDDEDVSSHELAKAFFKYNFLQIPASAKKGIVLALIPSLLYYVTQFNFAILVNCALRGASTGQCNVFNFELQFDSLLAVLVPVLIVRVVLEIATHIVDRQFRFCRLGGQAILKLRSNILTTMLQMSDDASAKFDSGDIQKAIDTHSEKAIANVWIGGFDMIREIGSVIIKGIISIQIILRPSIVSDIPTLLVLLACPVIQIVCASTVFIKRAEQTSKNNMATFDAEENWAAYIQANLNNRDLIRSYKQGWYFTELFQKKFLKEHNGCNFKAQMYTSNTMWFARYIFLFVNLAVVFFGSGRVAAGALAAGDFLVLMGAIDGFGKDLLDIAKCNEKIMIGTEAVRKIAAVLNAETYRGQVRKRSTIEEELDGRPGRVIACRKAYYSYPTVQEGQDSHAVASLDLDLPTGSLICFPCAPTASKTSPVAVGVNTLFKMFSGRLFPKEGEVHIAKRWRTIYVPVVPQLFDGTLMYNLMFSDRADPDRDDIVWDICRGLGLSKGLLEKPDFDVGMDGQRLKFSDKVVVAIARALLHDVDVLCISSALDVLGESHGVKVLRFLQEYADRRGFGTGDMPLEHRHVKTIVYTSKLPPLQSQASHVVPLNLVAV